MENHNNYLGFWDYAVKYLTERNPKYYEKQIFTGIGVHLHYLLMNGEVISIQKKKPMGFKATELKIIKRI